jgi:hypothetical protein
MGISEANGIRISPAFGEILRLMPMHQKTGPEARNLSLSHSVCLNVCGAQRNIRISVSSWDGGMKLD